MIYSYETPLTMLLGIVGFIVVIWAQIKVSSNYKKYKNTKTKKDLAGVEVARAILDKNGLENIYVVEIKGELTDHFDPRNNVIRLSTEIFHGTSVASVSVAAHEVGHALQHKEGYTFMKFRSMLAPVVNFVTNIGYLVLLISVFAGILDYLLVGILIIIATLLFQLITLPVEFDASKRAKEELIKLKIIEKKEETDVKEMLNAAAMTYVASLISSILSLLRLIVMTRDRD